MARQSPSVAGSYPSCLAVAGYDGLLRSWAGLSATAWLDELRANVPEKA